ncbi:hypothetical protein FHJ30_03060 [Arthrobacter sp. BB-1]|uniref:zf-HC2 domain-containing protein n=1 Tax=unclassified Arthrobacter TaxID=235627 RepID=UPI00111270E1|nr:MULTISPECIES: zf-HC2 domain-containing protein [unclassified Arthrobacter]TNB75643.1 hypothetical protein FHJ30_03060 [Arthrobacter sp. BB-1]
MNTNETDRYRQWAAVYVLGALTPGEQGEYETHLAICAQCSAAVAEFDGLPELLDALTPAEARVLGRSRLAVKLPRETRLLLSAVAAAIRAANCGGGGTASLGSP